MFFGALVFFLLGPIQHQLLVKLQWSTMVIGVASKLPQIISNYYAQSTGQLSFITVFLSWIGTDYQQI